MNSIYTRIDPREFEVSEAVKLLNYNLDYVYELAKNLDKGNNTSITNIIPYADFNIISPFSSLTSNSFPNPYK